MSLDPLTALVDAGKFIAARVWPDPAEQARQILKLEELHQKGDLAELDAHVKGMMGQLEVNKAEAQHKSVFVAGWRPFIGWVGGSALAYQFVVYPLLCWFWRIAQAIGWITVDMEPPPVLETGALFSMITAMLGIGAMRSFDKKHGTQTDSIK